MVSCTTHVVVLKPKSICYAVILFLKLSWEGATQTEAKQNPKKWQRTIFFSESWFAENENKRKK